MLKSVLCAAFLSLASAAAAQPLSTAFTYQGELLDAGVPADGTFDLRLRLYDTLVGGAQLGSTLCVDNSAVVDGRFAVSLDFGAQFAGQKRFLEIEVRRDTGFTCVNPANFVILGPRQELTPSPNAIFALGTATAANATQLEGRSAAFYTNAANLTGTLPASSFTGTYSGAVTLTNSSNTFTGSGASLTNVNAATLDGLDSSAFLQVAGPFALNGSSTGAMISAQNASDTTDATGVRGVTTATTGVNYGGRFENASTAGFGVYGLATASTGNNRGVYGGTLSSTGAGVMGEATTGNAAGIYGFTTSPTGYGIYGWNNSTTGITRGVYGQTNSTGGRGVNGHAFASSGPATGVYGGTSSPEGRGVIGECAIGSGTAIGVLGRVQSPDGRAVVGTCLGTAGANTGVTGESASAAGRGVHGVVTATTGTTFGVHGESFAAQGRGVFGRCYETVGVNYGVYGQSASGSGFGVYGVGFTGVHGESNLNTAIIGHCTSPTGGAGVHGVATRADRYGTFGTADLGYGVAGSGSTYGVFSFGRTGASGTKSFRIDHPSDPANKYLYHYSAESDEVINFYSGKASLDEQGEAVITLPAYFAAINKDPRYTLTAVGAAMPMLHIAEEIDEDALASAAAAGPGEPVVACSFRIAGGAPGGKVSWRIDAVRNDRWVQRHGAPVETDKPRSERGAYQHPELYSLPEERASYLRYQPPSNNAE